MSQTTVHMTMGGGSISRDSVKLHSSSRPCHSSLSEIKGYCVVDLSLLSHTHMKVMGNRFT